MIDQRRRCSFVACLTLAAWCSSMAALAQQAPRDGTRPSAAGSATVSGVVMLDDAEPKPLRRVRVMLNGPALTVGRTVITNDDGTFSVDRLPAGRYTVGAVKDGYVPMNYGAKRPGRQGMSIVLRDGETRRIALRLPRGAVITGTLVDPAGQPAVGVGVAALRHRYIPAAGERRLAPEAAISLTDDRGVYRIFGLPAGEYVVAAHLRPVLRTPGGIHTLSEATIRRALAEVRQAGSRAQPRAQPGPSTAAAPAAVETVDPPRPVSLAPMFYPGTAEVSNALRVTVARGEERAGVDFQVDYVRTATVSGIVSSSSGAAPAGVTLEPIDQSVRFEGPRSTRSAPDGQFAITGVVPGKYILIGRTIAPVALFGMTEIVVDGDDVGGIGLTLEPGLTISGRVVFEATRTLPVDLSKTRVRVPLMMRAGASMTPLPSLEFQPQGRFTIEGIVPGVYRPVSALQGIRTAIAGWWLKSLAAGGRELLDTPLDLRQSTSDMVVTFSARASELTGTVTDPQGNPTSDYTVVVFPPEKASWFNNSRRVAGAQPGADGRYSIRNLPPGAYLLAVSDDLERNEWFDPDVLQGLAARAVRLTIAGDEKKVVNPSVSTPAGGGGARP